MGAEKKETEKKQTTVSTVKSSFNQKSLKNELTKIGRT